MFSAGADIAIISLTLATTLAGLWIWTVNRLAALRFRELDIQATALACSTSEFINLRDRVKKLEAIADGIDLI